MGYNQKCARRMKQNQTSLILFLSRSHGRRRRQKPTLLSSVACKRKSATGACQGIIYKKNYDAKSIASRAIHSRRDKKPSTSYRFFPQYSFILLPSTSYIVGPQ